MKIVAEGFEFDFTNALKVTKFDEQDRAKPSFHGLSHIMSAVDLVVELSDRFVFVEVKDYRNGPRRSAPSDFDALVKSLKTKFRDSFLYRWAERQIGKPVAFLCLVTMDNALNHRLTKELQRSIPEGKPTDRWARPMATVTVAVNKKKWNQRFPNWTVKRK